MKITLKDFIKKDRYNIKGEIVGKYLTYKGREFLINVIVNQENLEKCLVNVVFNYSPEDENFKSCKIKELLMSVKKGFTNVSIEDIQEIIDCIILITRGRDQKMLSEHNFSQWIYDHPSIDYGYNKERRKEKLFLIYKSIYNENSNKRFIRSLFQV